MDLIFLFEISIIGVIAFFAVFAIRKKYEGAKEHTFPKIKPFFVLFPKYTVEYALSVKPDGMGQFDNLIDVRLSELGFRKIEESPITYQRGLKYGDFTTKVAQIIVEFDVSRDKEGLFRIYYGWVCLFDTGDLWKLARQIKDALE